MLGGAWGARGISTGMNLCLWLDVCILDAGPRGGYNYDVSASPPALAAPFAFFVSRLRGVQTQARSSSSVREKGTEIRLRHLSLVELRGPEGLLKFSPSLLLSLLLQ